MKLTIIDFVHHRNGIGGAPSDVVLFNDTGPEASRKFAILFEQDAHCAVLDLDKLAKSDIAFGAIRGGVTVSSRPSARPSASHHQPPT